MAPMRTDSWIPVAGDVREATHEVLWALIRELDAARMVLDRLEIDDPARFVRVAALTARAAHYDSRYREGLELARRAAGVATDSPDPVRARAHLAPGRRGHNNRHH